MLCHAGPISLQAMAQAMAQAKAEVRVDAEVSEVEFKQETVQIVDEEKLAADQAAEKKLSVAAARAVSAVTEAAVVAEQTTGHNSAVDDFDPDADGRDARYQGISVRIISAKCTRSMDD